MVVVLNGGSSAGKSTLARAVQRVFADAGEPWIIFGWDDFVPRMPDRWHGGPSGIGDRAMEGVSYRVVRDEPLEALLDLGDAGRRVLAGYHRAVAALARAGNNVLVEEVIITAPEWDDWQQALAGLDTRWIAVRCDVEIAVGREHARGDRYRGLARGTAAVVHLSPTYDMEIDTTNCSVERAALDIARVLAR
jgi:chloramphenicol 3-O phosphotransferase